MESARYVIGLDLGTTNTAVAYVDLQDEMRRVRYFEVPQLVAPGELGHAPTLPSFLYLPGQYDVPEGSLALPWDPERNYAVGVLAREHGSRVPGRLVASAKSWLCHGGVARTSPVLPWKAPGEVERVSPVTASARFLHHVREAWNDRADVPGRFEQQEIVLTVPASFDEVARELTVEAAREAGIPQVILIEEPLAAFYAWLDGQVYDVLHGGDLVLVCDVGGGTSDFSVIGVRRSGPDVRFERLAVGEHIMLGGDNMDHTLGRSVEGRLAGGTGKLDPPRWQQLVQQCRTAKERLLTEGAPEEEQVSIAPRGSRLIAETLTASLRREDVERLVLDGFFPHTTLETPLQSRRRAGLMELGLPYESDPAITRHLAAFWRRFENLLRTESGRNDPRPSYVLFNGGVLTPEGLRRRLLRIIGSWFDPSGDWKPIELAGPRLDLAVAHGAAYYGLVRRGERMRVRSGSPRTYYVAVGSTDEEIAPTSSGHPAPPQTAVCLIPRGADEGFEARLEDMRVEALANQPVTFHLLSSDARTGDAVGDVVRLRDEEVNALPPIRTVLRFGRKGVARALPIRLGVRLTEIGTIELWCYSSETDHRWRLAFDLRERPDVTASAPSPASAAKRAGTESREHEETGTPASSPDAAESPEHAAVAAIRRFFERDELPSGQPWRRLESILQKPRDAWTMPVVRKFADVLLTVPRGRSARHEVAWFDLVGFMLRPGYGDPVDEWRLQEVWKRYMEGLRFPLEIENGLAWWRLWRRVSGGLSAEKQAQVYYDVRPYVQHKVRTRKRHPRYPRRLDEREKLEAWKALAAFERLAPEVRGAIGQIVVEQLQRKMSVSALWALSRLGTRRPVYGPLDKLVAAEEVGGWLKTLLSVRLARHESVAFTLALLAQRTGDRGRDVPDGVRQQVVGRLRQLPRGPLLLPMLTEEGADPPPELEAWLMDEPVPPPGTALPDRIGILVDHRSDASSS